jgi:peptidoglycan-associated lipoprotein
VVITSGCHKNVATTPSPPVLAPKAGTNSTRPGPSIDDLLNRLIDAHFDYNKSDLQSGALSALSQDVNELKAALKEFPNARFVIEGHCDERGSAEYKLALCDRRAIVVREFLIQVGIPPDRLSTISYGTEHPVCVEDTEDCSQRNRRTHVSAAR